MKKTTSVRSPEAPSGSLPLCADCRSGLPAHGVQLVPTADRAAVGALIAMP